MVILLIKARDLIPARTISSQELVLSSFCLQRPLTEREHKKRGILNQSPLPWSIRVHGRGEGGREALLSVSIREDERGR
ncbi:hypothetical protein BRARA_J01488 [Brassica rapa]|uniref:Uncharacterized protein n=1 Tax=Brassica campestris TaxID=3711 RepID=A0A397XKN5_BRACM|nr:hypothetical protein BRARA_J01488 [Brassica rapa]